MVDVGVLATKVVLIIIFYAVIEIGLRYLIGRLPMYVFFMFFFIGVMLDLIFNGAE